jgi:hypothetical protein
MGTKAIPAASSITIGTEKTITLRKAFSFEIAIKHLARCHPKGATVLSPLTVGMINLQKIGAGVITASTATAIGGKNGKT